MHSPLLYTCIITSFPYCVYNTTMKTSPFRYRGRGGYYRGNMYRGGYRGYRGRGNNRGGAQFNQQPISSNGPQNPSHSTQQSNRGAPIAAAAGQLG